MEENDLTHEEWDAHALHLANQVIAMLRATGISPEMGTAAIGLALSLMVSQGRLRERQIIYEAVEHNARRMAEARRDAGWDEGSDAVH